MKTDWFVALLPIGITVIFYGVIIFILVLLWKLYKGIKSALCSMQQLQTKVDKIMEYIDKI